ncbi:MAG: hypothetical protein N4A46_04130 [Schleiferiaceae bacterium]|nr:hypothetical protein [Schleiferiaceae bacterium]
MKKVINILILTLIAVSCERNTDILGPSLVDRFGPFSVFEAFDASMYNVDFSVNQTVEFTATFSKQVTWEVHIVGQLSGAEKVLTGLSNRIDAANGGVWDGTITKLPMFKKEPCFAYLYIDDVDTLFIDTLSNLINVNETRVLDGFIVTDWENGVNDGFNVFVQSGADMRFDTVNDITGPEGSVFYETSGDVGFSDDLGNISMPKSSFTDSNFTLSTNNEIVYFNVFAKKGPNAVQDIYVFQFMEDDNDDGVYNPGDDDLHEYVINSGLTQDWEQYVAKYADLVTTNSGGGGQKNPDKLIQMLVLPIGVKEPFEGFLDYLVFTENGPLVP